MNTNWFSQRKTSATRSTTIGLLDSLPLHKRRWFRALALLLLSTFPLFANAKGENCLRNVLRLLAPLSSKSINWQNANVFSATTLPQSYKKLLDRHPSVVQLRRDFGEGERLDFVLGSYAHDVERDVTIAQNGHQIQAVYLKQLLTEVFPKATFREYRFDDAPGGNSIRRSIQMHIRDSGAQGREVNWQTAGQTNNRSVEMSLLKAANPASEVFAKEALRSNLGISKNSKVASVYASLNTDPWVAYERIDDLLKKTNVDTVIVSSSRNSEVQSHLKSANKDVKIVSSKKVVPTEVSAKTVIFNESRGKLPAIHASADLVVVIGSPNVMEPINVGIPTLAFRKAEAGFAQSVWNRQTQLIAATGGGHIADSRDEMVSLVNSPNLSKPKLKTFEVVDADGSSAIDRLLTNIANVMKQN